jgi:hypothetical protein
MTRMKTLARQFGMGLIVLVWLGLIVVAAVELMPIVDDVADVVRVKASSRGVLAGLGALAILWWVNRRAKRIEEEMPHVRPMRVVRRRAANCPAMGRRSADDMRTLIGIALIGLLAGAAEAGD